MLSSLGAHLYLQCRAIAPIPSRINDPMILMCRRRDRKINPFYYVRVEGSHGCSPLEGRTAIEPPGSLLVGVTHVKNGGLTEGPPSDLKPYGESGGGEAARDGQSR